MINFEGFGLPEALIHTLTRIGYATPTPIQAQAIPFAMEGRDILGSAQTGTGKTAAFSIPLIAKLKTNPEGMGLILTPTRELAVQVEAVIKSFLSKNSKIKTALLIGGEKIFKQFGALKQNPRIIVGTPGRINDHLMRKTLRLDQVNYLVLDETDRMLDMGFGVQIDKILKYVPSERQTLLFSATLPPTIVKLANKYQNNPMRVAVGSVTTPIKNIKQETINVTDANKYTVLLDELHKREGTVIIFVRTRRGADKLMEKLSRDGHSADALHGDLQHKRRERVIKAFRDEQFRVLVATDVAARGLDIPHIEHVINYDLPQVADDYIHRIGRTARAGAEGSALCLIAPGERRLWTAIDKLINKGEHTEQTRGGGGYKQDRPQRDRDYSRPQGRNKFGSGKRFESKPRFEKKSDDSFGEKPRFSEKPDFNIDFNSERKPEGGFRELKSFGDKPRFGKPKFGSKPRFGDKPKFGKISGGEEKPEGGFRERKNFGERKSFGARPKFGNKPRFGDKPEFGASAGEKKSEGGFSRSKDFRKKFDAKPQGDAAPAAGGFKHKKKFGGKGGDAKPFQFKAHRRNPKIKSI